MTHFHTPCRAAALVLLAVLAACSKTGPSDAPASKAGAAPTTAAAGALTPNLSADVCKLLPPERISEYKAAHDVFTSEAGLEPAFEKGHSFRDGETITFKWNQGSARPLGLTVSVLKDCSPREIMNSPLFETAAGSGQFAVPLGISGGGSSYPDGSPGLVEVTTTQVTDAVNMKGKTTVIGSYTVRLTGPKN